MQKYHIPIITLALLTCSCGNDSEPQPLQPNADLQQVTLTLSLAEDASSRADGLSEETGYPVLQRYMAAEDAYVVTYNSNGTVRSVINGLLDGKQGDKKRSLSVFIPQNQDASVKCRALVNVAQASTWSNKPQDITRLLGTYVSSADAVLRSDLLANAFDSDGHWPLTDNGGYLPMQSEMLDISITTGTQAVIPVYRSLAKIGVICTAPGFVLSKVRVVNQHTYGAFISKYATANIGLAHKQFSRPDVPSATYRSQSVEYDVTYDNDRYEVLERIFVPEHSNTESDIDQPLYIQIGGYFDDQTEDDMQWYNLYFTDNGHSTGNPINVIRNYSYTFNIAQINRPERDVVIEIRINPNWAVTHKMDIIEE